MANVKVNLDYQIYDGVSLTFKAPCNCDEVTGLIVYYPNVETDTETSTKFVFKDTHGNELTGLGNLFLADSYVKVVLDTVNGFAYIQNADTNKYLEDKFKTLENHTTNKSNPHGVTASQISAVPTSRKVNNKALSSDISLSASDVGAVPTSRTINGKALSSNITLSASDVGAAASSHGNHVPATQTASNKVFLRNDNTWQTVTPANIGAATSNHSHSNYVPTSRTVNGKALSGNISLSASDVGAAASSHSHDYVPKTSGSSSVQYDGFGNIVLTKGSYGVAITDQAFRSIESGKMYLGNSSYRWITLFSNNACNTTSDRNLKENIEPLSQKYVDLFDKLQPVSYEFIGEDHDRVHVGFISQDIKSSMDEVGLTDLDFGGYCRDIKTRYDEETGEDVPVYDADGNPEYIYSLRYGEFVALNTKMIQMNRAKIAEQQKEIDELKEMVAKLVAAQK